MRTSRVITILLNPQAPAQCSLVSRVAAAILCLRGGFLDTQRHLSEACRKSGR